MNHFRVVSVALCAVIASSSYAASFLQKINGADTKAKVSTSKTMKATKAISSQYPDFSGKWTGQCSDGEEYASSIDIESNPSVMKVNGYTFYLEDFNNQGSSSNAFSGANSSVNRFTWSDDKSALKGTLVDVSTYFGEDQLSTSINEVKLYLNENAQLVIESAYKEFTGVKRTAISGNKCVYTKQPS